MEIPFFHHRVEAPTETPGIQSVHGVVVTENSLLVSARPQPARPDYGTARPLTGELTSYHPPKYDGHRAIIVGDSVDPASRPTPSNWRPRRRV